MPTLSIAGAAREWGISRQTIYNKISEGILSVTKDASDATRIDPAEMLRVFGEPKTEARHVDEDGEPVSNGKGHTLRHLVEIEVVRREASEKRALDLEAQLSTLQRQLERLEAKEDARDRQLESALRSVTEALRVALPAPSPQELPTRKGFLERILKL
jgi:hypothetical protein